MPETIEGIHYIFDRYAYLGVERDASKDDIHKIIREKRAANHPDRLIRASDEIRATATRVRELVNQCAEILLDDELRPLYDERLAEFERDKPKLVSTSGTPIIDPTQEYIDIDALLDDAEGDFTVLEKKAAELIQFDPERLEMIKNLFEADKENPALKKAYRKELNHKLTFVTIMEDIAWSKAGVQGTGKSAARMVFEAGDYANAVEEKITRIAESGVTQGLNQRRNAVAIGVAKAPLLLTDGRSDEDKEASAPVADDKALSTMTAEVMAEMQAKAVKNFTTRADYVRKAALAKQETLSELVALTDFKIIKEPAADTDSVDLYLVSEQEADDGSTAKKIFVGFRMELEGEDASIRTPLMDLTGQDPDVLAKQEAPGALVVIDHNTEVTDFMTEVHFVGMKLAERIGELKNTAPEAKERPARKPRTPRPGL